MTFRLGERSRIRLSGVHPGLVRVVERAIALTSQDFLVLDGLRTPEQQADLVARGASKTLASKHLRQPDGFSHAVDLVPWANGAPRWEWALVYPVAEAMHKAARWEGLALRWGGVWDRRLAELPGTSLGLQSAVLAYAKRHPGPDFLDGPHFELA